MGSPAASPSGAFEQLSSGRAVGGHRRPWRPLGAKRRGLLAHRSIRGEGALDRERLTEAGLAVGELEQTGRLTITEFDPDEPPEASPAPWQETLHRALARGFTALWYSRFAIGADDEDYRRVGPFERAWDQSFAGRPVVTLGPYLVGELDGAATLDRLAGVASVHDGVLLSGDAQTILMPTGRDRPPTPGVASA